MSAFGNQTYALMRIVTGLLFLCHGSQKLFGYPLPTPEGAPAFVTWVGGGVEFFGGVLVAVGLFTHWAAFICSGQMAVAYWLVHGPQHLFPLINRGELAVLYCFAFLFISAKGPGIWSLDGARSSR